MLDETRVKDCVWMFFEIIKVDSKYQWNGIPIADVMPFLRKDLTRYIIEAGDKSEAALSWLADAVFYMRGDTDDMPAIDLQWDIK